MELGEFKQEKIGGRSEISKKAIEVLKNLNPIALHQFGSGLNGFKDEFSDLDFFVTLTDEEFTKSVSQREEIYSKVASIVIRLYGSIPNPVGWYHDLVIHETKHGLFHVDYYLTPKSKIILPPNAFLVYGEDFPPGSWATWTTEPTEAETKSPERQLDSILAMSYIGVKGVVRKWEPKFYDYLRGLYNEYQEMVGKKLVELPTETSFGFIYTILDTVLDEGSRDQKMANRKIKNYAKKVEELYK